MISWIMPKRHSTARGTNLGAQAAVHLQLELPGLSGVYDFGLKPAAPPPPPARISLAAVILHVLCEDGKHWLYSGSMMADKAASKACMAVGTPWPGTQSQDAQRTQQSHVTCIPHPSYNQPRAFLPALQSNAAFEMYIVSTHSCVITLAQEHKVGKLITPSLSSTKAHVCYNGQTIFQASASSVPGGACMLPTRNCR